jgi:hypothetical protein
MRKVRKLRPGVVLAGAALAVAFVAASSASPSHEPDLSNVATANTRSVGYAPATKFATELAGQVVAQGASELENPTTLIGFYGYENDVVSAGDPTKPQMVPTSGVATEAQKTEPDENTYLSFKHALNGPDPDYYYGKQFLYQGHEAAASVGGVRQGYITRINLDADAKHRVTLLATRDSSGAAINTIDGSGWDPWAQKLIFTTENQNTPTYSATPDYPSTVVDVSGALGRGGYEGVVPDSAGNITILEDIGGANKPGTTARIPNSFVFRYVPESPGDLAHGKLQALQVLNNVNHQPITQATQTPLNSTDQLALHAYGSSFHAQWVTVHDTAVDGNAPFNANLAAKAEDATPFKRPENGRFRPGTGFTDSYFDETGDTNATSPENANAGGWCSIFKLSQSRPGASTARLSIFYKCDGTRAGFDNATFLSRDLLTFVEDAGDTLHGQRNALDSGWVFDVTTDYSDPSNQPVRWLAEGRDPSATIDSAAGGFGKNDGDNEITGSIVSDGDPTVQGLLGAKNPHLFQNKEWRFFYTEQHGDNRTYEVVARN